ncbi:MAG TPA: phosphoribosylformylglycinamidine synthase subunit PurS [Candidatus Dormibacteraeota bacterium]|nr:phosphoribosylformylglycinamidine synthase subunit PurS [Candidatus Dormibacteraeota bacterium]
MSSFTAEVVVTLRPVINDPQGLSVRAGLRRLGFDGVVSARVGKFVELVVEADDEASARAAVTRMCERLLCNPVIEDWRIDSLRVLDRALTRPPAGGLPPAASPLETAP